MDRFIVASMMFICLSVIGLVFKALSDLNDGRVKTVVYQLQEVK